MSKQQLNLGNLVTPNGASLIFGQQSSTDAQNIQTANTDTWKPYNIIIDEEVDEDLTADMIEYSPTDSSQITSTNVQQAIIDLETIIHQTADDMIPVTINEWDSANTKNDTIELKQLIINKIPSKDIWNQMDKNDNEIYLIQEDDASAGVFYAVYGITTFEDLAAAYNGGKQLICIYNNSTVCYLSTYTENTAFSFTTGTAGIKFGSIITLRCRLNGSVTEWALENTSGTEGDITTALSLASNTKAPLSTNTRYYRPILVSTEAPTAADGEIGDIWIQYSV